jgi:hypothetical protein
MRQYFLLVIIVLSSKIVFGQDDEIIKELNINNYNEAGYIKNVRLDSVTVNFAVLYSTNLSNSGISNYNFDIGQQAYSKKDKSLMFVDKEGHPLTFNSTATMLNFLDYNGWELKETISKAAEYFNKIYIFKKK